MTLTKVYFLNSKQMSKKRIPQTAQMVGTNEFYKKSPSGESRVIETFFKTI
jgi:hypothetical protein